MALLDQSITMAFAAAAPEENTLLPEGEYTLQVSKAELRATKNGGQMIAADFVVLGPTYQGRHVWNNFNIANANVQAVQIGLSQLKALTTAGGFIGELKDDQQLVGLTVKARVSIEKSKNPAYGDSNRVGRFKPAGSVSAPTAAPMPDAAASFFETPHAPAAAPQAAAQSWFK